MSLQELLRSQLLDKFRRAKDKGGVYLLVFDEESKEMLDNYVDMQQAMDACGASFADPLFKKRKPQPEKDALYFIKPTAKAMRQINLDFQDPDHPRYRRIHFLFTAACSPSSMRSSIHAGSTRGCRLSRRSSWRSLWARRTFTTSTALRTCTCSWHLVETTPTCTSGCVCPLRTN